MLSTICHTTAHTTIRRPSLSLALVSLLVVNPSIECEYVEWMDAMHDMVAYKTSMQQRHTPEAASPAWPRDPTLSPAAPTSS
jgi:hypothetical protein